MRQVLSLPLILALAALVGCSQDRITGDPKPIDNQHPLADVGAVPNPTVIGPIAATVLPGEPSRAYPFFSAAVDLASRGYVEEEFFIEGTANRYTLPDRATASIIDGGHAYRTRMVVRRPASPAAFNGTVVMEWQNVTAGFDFDGLWLASHDHLMRRGYAWIGVSNQANAVQVSPSSLRVWSPSRYGALDVTEGGIFTQDELSYDIFSQAAQAVRTPQGVDPMGGLHVQRVVAVGISQGADYPAKSTQLEHTESPGRPKGKAKDSAATGAASRLFHGPNTKYRARPKIRPAIYRVSCPGLCGFRRRGVGEWWAKGLGAVAQTLAGRVRVRRPRDRGTHPPGPISQNALAVRSRQSLPLRWIPCNSPVRRRGLGQDSFPSFAAVTPFQARRGLGF